MKDDQCDYTRDDRFQKGTATVDKNVLLLKTYIHFKHLTVPAPKAPIHHGANVATGSYLVQLCITLDKNSSRSFINRNL